MLFVETHQHVIAQSVCQRLLMTSSARCCKQSDDASNHAKFFDALHNFPLNKRNLISNAELLFQNQSQDPESISQRVFHNATQIRAMLKKNIF